jgi:hypothetical protein
MVYMSVICPTTTPPRARAPESRGPLRSTLTVSPTSNSDVSPHARLVYIFLVVDILDFLFFLMLLSCSTPLSLPSSPRVD